MFPTIIFFCYIKSTSRPPPIRSSCWSNRFTEADLCRMSCDMKQNCSLQLLVFETLIIKYDIIKTILLMADILLTTLFYIILNKYLDIYKYNIRLRNSETERSPYCVVISNSDATPYVIVFFSNLIAMYVYTKICQCHINNIFYIFCKSYSHIKYKEYYIR